MNDEYKHCEGCLFCDKRKCDTCPFNWKGQKEKQHFELVNVALASIIIVLFTLLLILGIKCVIYFG